MDQHLTLKQLKEKLKAYDEAMKQAESRMLQMVGQQAMLQALVNELENPVKIEEKKDKK